VDILKIFLVFDVFRKGPDKLLIVWPPVCFGEDSSTANMSATSPCFGKIGKRRGCRGKEQKEKRAQAYILL